MPGGQSLHSVLSPPNTGFFCTFHKTQIYMPITINVVITDDVLTANDSAAIKDIGHAMGINDPVNQPLGDIENALVAWTKRKLETERNRGRELRLAHEYENSRLFPAQ